MRTAVPLMALVIEMSCDMCCIVYSMFIFLQCWGGSLFSKLVTEMAAVPAVHPLYRSVLHGVLPDHA
jgi:hypothetical protein